MIYISTTFTVAVLFTTILSFPLHEEVNPDHTVIVFGFSGMPWNTLEHYDMPAFEKLKAEGVHVRRKHDPFQTESLPAFVTLSTGLQPDLHGMLSNKMIDLKTGYSFDLKDNDPKWWKQVKPIWIRNQETGNKSALCYWPGHHISFNGRKAEYSCDNTLYVDPFRDLTTKGEITQEVMSFEHRVDRVKYWLTKANHTERPSFIAVYFEEPLKTMAKYGIHSNETRHAFARVNNVTKSMMDFLVDEGLDEKINFVVTGESGAVEISGSGDIFLDDYLQKTGLARAYKIIDNGPITTINPTKVNNTQKLLDVLKNATDAITVYDGSKLPEGFHYTTKDRTMPIILVANKSMRINRERTEVPPNKASLGYDGRYPSTHSLLLARGPAFKEGYYINELPNVDIYNMFCEALKIKPDTNCGNQKNVKDAFKKPSKWYVVVYKSVVSSPSRFTVAIIVALILLFTALYLIILSISKATEKCRWLQNRSRNLEVFTPNKAFQSHADGGEKHLLQDEESDVSDLEEDLHFHMHKEIDSK